MRETLAEQVAFIVPGSPDARTGGPLYDRKIAAALERLDWNVDWHSWPAGFPFPSGADRQEARDDLASLPDNALVLVDGLAYGAIPDIAREQAKRLRLVALVHHPLALETGLLPDRVDALEQAEREALTFARAVIVTSNATAALLKERFSVPGSFLTVAIPGIELPPPVRRTPSSSAPRIFSLGSVTPRKAHHILVAALGTLAHLDWSCVIAGNLQRDSATATALSKQIAALGLTSRIDLVGEVSESVAEQYYRDADIFALASVYEGYGMVLSEAMSYGLPIVATTGGAIQEVVPADAGLLVNPGNETALAQALETLLTDSARRANMAAASRRAAESFPTWEESAAIVSDALRKV